ncbi:glycosyltransferase family 87 protein [Nocardioides pacificus]
MSRPASQVAPTRDDRVVRALSEPVGGPLGERATRHPWWTPLRVLLALTALCFSLGMAQKAPCWSDGWTGNGTQYSAMCYSDLPHLYTGRGFVELAWPYDDDAEVRDRHRVMEYPVGISYYAWASAWVTHWVSGSPDLETRYRTPSDQLWSIDGVERERSVFVAVNAIGFALVALLTTYFLSRVNPRRPWDAAAFAVSPALLLTGLINWDLLPVVLVAAALWAWARDRPLLTGVLIGLGTATKLYPLFLLGGILVICLRQRRWRDLALASAATVVAWVLANLPAFLTGPEEWKVFWSFNSERGPDLGSLWLVVAQAADATISAGVVNNVSWAFFGLWCLGVLVIGLKAPQTPRLAQLGLLVVAGFLLVNKVYSPQYVLWLLPLAVLARPRWRDLLIWQAGEVLYFAMVWWYLGDYLAPAGGGDAGFYWLAIVLRLAAEVYLVVVVARDVLSPRHDPVERVGTS